MKRKPKSKTVSATVSTRLRLEQSRRDKAKSMETPGVKNVESFFTMRVGDLKTKDDAVVLITPIISLNGVREYVDARRLQITDSEKHAIIDVKKLAVECVNASTNGPIVVIATIGLESKRTIVPVGNKAIISFQNFSSKEGNTELSIVVPHYGGSGAEAWFVVKAVLNTRFVY